MPIDPSTAFVSYSREDLEFVLRLTKDLKAKGAKVWMDKLDIRLGQRWELEVENALNACSRMLVIVSPASVASKNVLAEAAYAIDEGKEVIPVVIQECKIPFRLRPFQYADFRTDYDSGLNELLTTLGGEQEPIPPSTTAPPEHTVAPIPESEKKLRELQRRAESGDDAAILELGDAYRDGQFVAKDVLQSVVWYRKAASAGNTAAMRRLGALYAMGFGVPQSNTEAGVWYRKAAEAGDADAMFELAYRYEFGHGVAMDYDQARSWYLESARLGRQDVGASLERIAAKEAAEQSRREEEERQARAALETSRLEEARSAAAAERALLEQQQREREAAQEKARQEELERQSIAAEQARLAREERDRIAAQEKARQEQLERKRLAAEQARTIAEQAQDEPSGPEPPSQQEGESVRSTEVVTKRGLLANSPAWVKLAVPAVALLVVMLVVFWGSPLWKPQSSGTQNSLFSVAFVSPQVGWAVGDDGTILHTADGGQSWQAQSSGTQNSLLSVAFVSPQVGWAVGNKGTILHYGR